MKKEVSLYIAKNHVVVGLPWVSKKTKIKITSARGAVVKGKDTVAVVNNDLIGGINISSIFGKKNKSTILVKNITKYIKEGSLGDEYLQSSESDEYWILVTDKNGDAVPGLDFVTNDIQEIKDVFEEFFIAPDLEEGEGEEGTVANFAEEKYKVKIEEDVFSKIEVLEKDKNLEIIDDAYFEGLIKIKNKSEYKIKKKENPVKVIFIYLSIFASIYALGYSFLSKDTEVFKEVKNSVCSAPRLISNFDEGEKSQYSYLMNVAKSDFCSDVNMDFGYDNGSNVFKEPLKEGISPEEYTLMGIEEFRNEVNGIFDPNAYSKVISQFNRAFGNNVAGWPVLSIKVESNKVWIKIKRVEENQKISELLEGVKKINKENNFNFVRKIVSKDFSEVDLNYSIKVKNIFDSSEEIQKITESEIIRTKGLKEKILSIKKSNPSNPIWDEVNIDKEISAILDQINLDYNNYKNGGQFNIRVFSKKAKDSRVAIMDKIANGSKMAEIKLLERRYSDIEVVNGWNIITKNEMFNDNVTFIRDDLDDIYYQQEELKKIIKLIIGLKDEVYKKDYSSISGVDKSKYTVINPEEQINSLKEDYYIYEWKGLNSNPAYSYPKLARGGKVGGLFKPYAHKFKFELYSNKDTIGFIPMESLFNKLIANKWIYVESIEFSGLTGQWVVKLYYYK